VSDLTDGSSSEEGSLGEEVEECAAAGGAGSRLGFIGQGKKMKERSRRDGGCEEADDRVPNRGQGNAFMACAAGVENDCGIIREGRV
jgi:hypothetical protein